MRLLSAEQYKGLIAGAELLRSDGYGPKVFETADGRIVKLFRIKRWWSSAVLYPYSLRFKHNSLALKRRGFRCVTVEDVFYCHAVRRHGVVYRKLPGEPLDRLLVAPGGQADQAFRDYAAFIARLHASRVYFRSLHPGNVLRQEDGEHALIDVGDMRFPRQHLSVDRRIRNFAHLLRSPEFREAVKYHSPEAFLDAYLEAAGLGEDQAPMQSRLQRQFLRPLAKAARPARPSRRR